MGHKKLQRFEAIRSSLPTYCNTRKECRANGGIFLKMKTPITLELACGKGEYTVGLSSLYPERNFIGVDLKGNRIYSGALECLQNNLHNAAFLRIQIDKIDNYFLPGEVSEIWITFPDPHLRTSRAKKRLTIPGSFACTRIF